MAILWRQVDMKMSVRCRVREFQDMEKREKKMEKREKEIGEMEKREKKSFHPVIDSSLTGF